MGFRVVQCHSVLTKNITAYKLNLSWYKSSNPFDNGCVLGFDCLWSGAELVALKFALFWHLLWYKKNTSLFFFQDISNPFISKISIVSHLYAFWYSTITIIPVQLLAFWRHFCTSFFTSHHVHYIERMNIFCLWGDEDVHRNYWELLGKSVLPPQGHNKSCEHPHSVWLRS